MALANNYNPKEFEEKIFKLWEENGVGSPEKQMEAQKKILRNAQNDRVL